MNFYKTNHEVTFDDIKKFNYDNQRVGVIVHIRNDEGKILLQKRGIKSRDEVGLYEDIGGKVDYSDESFRNAIIRELKEEVGDEAKIQISNSIGIYHCNKNNINWIFIVYFGRYFEGKIKIMEPEKCQGYHFFTYDEAISSDSVTQGSKFLMKSLKKYSLF